MELKAFSIRDSKAEVFHRPFFSNTHSEAERNFAQLLQDDKSTIAQFPEDYDLYFLGVYDDATGVFKSLDTPQHMIKAAVLKKH